MEREDLTGQTLGRLTILEVASSSPGHKEVFWLCRCECGVFKSFSEYKLSARFRTPKVGSCGCAGRFRRKNSQTEACVLKKIARMKTAAARRGLEWSLTNDEVRTLIFSPCAYCASQPDLTHKEYWKSDRDTKIRYGGIDRVDSSIGYVSKNCVSCCKFCNRGKNDMSSTDFLAYLQELAAFQSTISI